MQLQKQYYHPVFIPQVKKFLKCKGFFDLHASGIALSIQDSNGEALSVAENLKGHIIRETGLELPIVVAAVPPDKKAIVLRFQKEHSEAESYSLSITENIIRIDSEGSKGLFYGVQTLAQLIRTSGRLKRLPCLEITDAPDFPNRGFYHDVTRGKVPTLATLKALVDKLAFYKINQLQLYVEHTFAWKCVPELWKDKDPLHAGEIRELDAYCRLNYIDLVPSLATFGHLYELLRLRRFEHLNELDIKASELPHNLWDRMAYYTIDVSREESFSLVRSMIDEYVPLFSSRYCNICCDETFDLGKGKNRELAAKVGEGRLYVDFVKKIIGAVNGLGKVPMLWGDIVLHHPELIREISDDVIFLNWAYDAGVTGKATAMFAKAGVKQYVCPGVQGWSRFANDITTASANIRRMARFGKRYGALGVLNTDWGDCGHVNFLANSFHGMALGAALSWNDASYGNNRLFDNAISAIEWGDPTGALARRLRELGSLSFYHFGNLYAWVHDMKGKWNREKEVRESATQVLTKRFKRASQLLEFLIKTKESGKFAGKAQDIDEFIWSAKAVRWTLGLIAFKKRNEYGQKNCPALYGNREHLLDETKTISEEFNILWMKRNKISELRNVTETFAMMLERIRNIPE